MKILRKQGTLSCLRPIQCQKAQITLTRRNVRPPNIIYCSGNARTSHQSGSVVFSLPNSWRIPKYKTSCQTDEKKTISKYFVCLTFFCVWLLSSTFAELEMQPSIEKHWMRFCSSIHYAQFIYSVSSAMDIESWKRLYSMKNIGTMISIRFPL